MAQKQKDIKTIDLTYDQAHDLVSKNPDLYWDGYTIVSWRENVDAFTMPNGLFRNGKWGIAFRHSFNEAGIWRVPVFYVNRRRR